MAKDPANRFADMEHFLKEIWTLRQSTAPDRTLIPEIHTLSSAHLDYESHLEQAKAKRNVRKLEKEVPGKGIRERHLRHRRKCLVFFYGALPQTPPAIDTGLCPVPHQLF
jgi:hypothetical protein